MQLLLNSSRALAGVVAALLVASMLSVGTTGTAVAVTPEKITVTVTAPGMSQLDGEVQVFRWSDEERAFTTFGRRWVEAGASSATVDVEVTAGTYYARYMSSTLDVVSPAYSDGINARPRLRSDPGTFTVTVGSDAATTILLTVRASFSGSLINPDGTPVESTGGRIDVFPADAGPSDARRFHGTITEGTFRAHVDAGNWRVKFRSWDEGFLDHTYEDVTVAQGERLTLPAVQLKRAPTTPVQGAVTLQGAPRADAEVHLLRVTDDGGWTLVTTTTTDSNGEYTFPLRDDRTYIVRAQGKGISTTFLGGSVDPKQAGTFRTAHGSRLPTIDTLPPATISGVLLADGSPVQGYVIVYSVTAPGTYAWQTYAETDEHGRWSGEVPFGDYVIRAQPRDVPFLTTHLGSQHAEEIEAAGSFRVEADERVTKDVRLVPVPMLVGSVVSIDGPPLAGASVEAFMWDETKKTWEFISEDRTDPDGTYLLPAREGQRLTLRFAKEGYLTEYLGGGPSRPTSPTATNTVAAKGRTTSVPTFTLEGTVQVTPVPPEPEPEPVKQAKATLKVKAAKKVRADKRASVRVRVLTVGRKNAKGAATGHVVVKMSAKGRVQGKKVRTLEVILKNGRATLKLPKLAKGKWAIKVAYQGNAKTSKASKQYTLKVIAAKKKQKR